jgi:hypothetical protein
MRFMLIAVIVAALSAPTLPALARRVEECGVERVNFLRGPSCAPEVFAESRSAACGVQSFKEAKDKICAGKEGSDFFTQCRRYLECPSSGLSPCMPRCEEFVPKPAGFHEESIYNGMGFLWSSEAFWVRNGKSFKCRNKAFSVESYKSCRHPSHGVERYAACIPEMVFADCAILKTRTELDAFLETVEDDLPLFGRLYVSNKALIAKLSDNVGSMACLVEKWDGNPLHVDIVDQLKGDYAKLSGKAYVPGDCSSALESRVTCPADSRDDVCVAQANVDSALRLKNASADLEAYTK